MGSTLAMIDPSVLIAAISGAVTVILAIITGIVGPLILYRLNQSDRAAAIRGQELIDIKTNVAMIEKSTNGMKEQLLLKTAEASHAQGVLVGKEAGEAKAVLLLTTQIPSSDKPAPGEQ